jgi:hypothetical protein
MWPKIKAANPGLNENSIQAGQVITLPPKSGAAADTGTPAAADRRSGSPAGSSDNAGAVTTGARRGSPGPSGIPAKGGVTPVSGAAGPSGPLPTGGSTRTDTGGTPTDSSGERTDAGKTAGSESRSGTEVGEAAGTYVAGQDETLFSIARKLLGDGSKWNVLYEANRDKLARPEDLRAGMQLRIPSETEQPAKVANSKKSGKGSETAKRNIKSGSTDKRSGSTTPAAKETPKTTAKSPARSRTAENGAEKSKAADSAPPPAREKRSSVTIPPAPKAPRPATRSGAALMKVQP